jgi:ribosome-binding protein aMBF1 (putative translation factor)
MKPKKPKQWSEMRRERIAANPALLDKIEEARLRMDLAQFVYDLRTAAGLTQTELARRMGTTQSAIARLEGGGTNPSTELLQHLGNALGVRLVLAVEPEAAGGPHQVTISGTGPTAVAS